jgi:CDP-diacylglycerol--glycerol-3-phosphate 3-phosphatidyltransferase
MLITFVGTGLWGLGVPYILPAGLWVVAAGSVITFGQRMLAVRRGMAAQAAEAVAAADRPGTKATGESGPRATQTIE